MQVDKSHWDVQKKPCAVTPVLTWDKDSFEAAMFYELYKSLENKVP